MGSTPYISRVLFSILGPGRRGARRVPTSVRPWPQRGRKVAAPNAVGSGLSQTVVRFREAIERKVRGGFRAASRRRGRSDFGVGRVYAARHAAGSRPVEETQLHPD